MTRRLLPLIGYLVLVAGVLSANLIAVKASQRTDRQQLVEQRAGCERTNELRRQLNTQNAAFLHHNHITYSLFQDVAKTLPSDSRTAIRVREAVKEYKALESSYRSIKIVDCAEAYKADAS